MLISEAPSIVGPGHNLPPVTDLLREHYASSIAKVEEIAAEANALKRTVDSDDDLPAIAKLVKEARDLRQKLDANRSDENKPHLQAQRDTNSFFNTMIERLQKIQQTFERATSEYQQRKADEERVRLAKIAQQEREERDRRLAEAAAAQSELEGDIVLQQAERHEERAGHAEAAQRASVADLTRTQTEAGTVTSTKGYDFRVDNYQAIDLNELRDQFSVNDIDKAIRSHVRKHKNTKPLKGVSIFETNKATFR